MKTYLIRSFAAALMTVLVCSCNMKKELDLNIHQSPSASSSSEEGIAVPATLLCEPLDFELEGAGTKSVHSATDLTRRTDANYYLFKNGVLVRQAYFSDLSTFTVTYPSASDTYNLYILANIGEYRVPNTTTESQMATAVHFDYGSDSNYYSTISEKGFPMAQKFTGVSASSGTSFSLKRLVFTIRLKMDTSALTSSSMTFSSVCVKNAARDVFPFAERSVATEYLDQGDVCMTSDDIVKMNSGEEVIMYMLENNHGNTANVISDWIDKKGEDVGKDAASWATYIEIASSVTTQTATYSDNKYRAFLGTSPSTLDVKRSTYYTLTNEFVNDMVTEEEWRKLISIPTIKPIELTPTNCYDLITIKNYPLEAVLSTEIPSSMLSVTFDIPEINGQPVAECSYDPSTKKVVATALQEPVFYALQWNNSPVYYTIKCKVQSNDDLVERNYNIKCQMSLFSVKYIKSNENVTIDGKPYIQQGISIVGDDYTTRFMDSKNLKFKVTDVRSRFEGSVLNSSNQSNTWYRSENDSYENVEPYSGYFINEKIIYSHIPSDGSGHYVNNNFSFPSGGETNVFNRTINWHLWNFALNHTGIYHWTMTGWDNGTTTYPSTDIKIYVSYILNTVPEGMTSKTNDLPLCFIEHLSSALKNSVSDYYSGYCDINYCNHSHHKKYLDANLQEIGENDSVPTGAKYAWCKIHDGNYCLNSYPSGLVTPDGRTSIPGLYVMYKTFQDDPFACVSLGRGSFSATVLSDNDNLTEYERIQIPLYLDAFSGVYNGLYTDLLLNYR